MGEINGIEHNKGSKIYPQNQVILEFFFLYLGKTDMLLGKKCLFSIGNGAEIRSLEKLEQKVP